MATVWLAFANQTICSFRGEEGWRVNKGKKTLLKESACLVKLMGGKWLAFMVQGKARFLKATEASLHSAVEKIRVKSDRVANVSPTRRMFWRMVSGGALVQYLSPLAVGFSPRHHLCSHTQPAFPVLPVQLCCPVRKCAAAGAYLFFYYPWWHSQLFYHILPPGFSLTPTSRLPRSILWGGHFTHSHTPWSG